MKVFVVLPGDIDDPAAPSGGNTYDRRVCDGLVRLGWTVREIAVPGGWPRPSQAERAALTRALAAIPDRAAVLIDGLVACGVPEIVAPEARRLRVAVLLHLPLADEAGADLDGLERATVRAAAAVVATSAGTARRLTRHHGLDPLTVHVAAPGVDPAPSSEGTAEGSRLLCVAALTPRKAQDVLVDALSTLTDLAWTCDLVGAVDRDPAYVQRVRDAANDRIRLTGPRTGTALAETYAAADLLVLPSHAETYGMVVTEALARGIPVLATAVGGVPEALGTAPDASVPGMLIPAGDPAALTAALRRWLDEPGLRRRLRASARDRRATLPGWDTTAKTMADILQELR